MVRISKIDYSDVYGPKAQDNDETNELHGELKHPNTFVHSEEKIAGWSQPIFQPNRVCWCIQDLHFFCEGLCCPCEMFGNVGNILGMDYALSSCCGCILCVATGGTFLVPLRYAVRHTKGVPGSIINDFLSYIFCCPYVYFQLAFEGRRSGVAGSPPTSGEMIR